LFTGKHGKVELCKWNAEQSQKH